MIPDHPPETTGGERPWWADPAGGLSTAYRRERIRELVRIADRAPGGANRICGVAHGHAFEGVVRLGPTQTASCARCGAALFTDARRWR